MDFISLLTIVALVVLILYAYVKWSYIYWKRQGVYYIEPEFPYGNVKAQFKREMCFGDQFTQFYNHFKAKGVKGGGLFMFIRPLFLPVDLELIRNILQKDFGNFMNHGMFINEEVDPLTGNLFNLENDKWRNLRTKLSPTFTSGKMKMMFQTFLACTTGLQDILKSYSKLQDPVDIKEVVARFTTDVIGSCAFGIDCNSLKNPDSEFRQFARKIFNPDLRGRLKSWLFFGLPRDTLIKLRIKQTNDDIENFFMNVVKNTVEYRENNNVHRKDFMQLLLQLKNEGRVDENQESLSAGANRNHSGQTMTLEQLAAQCFIFFFAGYETSATTMTFALLELAINQDVQDKLREEIHTVLNKHHGEISYDAVMEMTYLDKVVHETLRKHPPFPGTPRVCNKDYQIPGTDIVLEAGTRIHIPIQGIQRDPEYYPEPDKFDPERFNEENKAKRPPYAFLTFGEGPRICIGARFGLLQVKVGLLEIIGNFKVTLHEKTKTPIAYATRGFISTVEGGVWLNVNHIETEKRKQ